MSDTDGISIDVEERADGFYGKPVSDELDLGDWSGPHPTKVAAIEAAIAQLETAFADVVHETLFGGKE